MRDEKKQQRKGEDVMTTEAAANDKWFIDHGEVLRLGRWLVADDRITSTKDLLYFFEKPWKWTDEYEVMLAQEGKEK